MKRLPTMAFGLLALATIAAVFITQHLKVTTPLVQDATGPGPTADAAICPRQSAQFYFALLHSADSVDVYIVKPGGAVVRTLATRQPGAVHQKLYFSWDGKADSGSPAAPGSYHVRVVLIHQHRTLDPLLDQRYDTPIIIRVKAAC